MKFALLCKRHYTNKDLLADRFGRLFHLPKHLVDLGHEGLIIAGDLHSGDNEQIEIGRLRFYAIPLSLVRLYAFIRKSFSEINKFKPNILIASGDSYLGFIGRKISRKLDIPFVFDVYDDYTTFDTNKIPGMKTLFYKSASTADLVVTSSEQLRKKIYPFNRNIVVIENGYDPALFRSIPQDDARARMNIPLSDTVIGYFGSISKDLGIDVLLAAVEILRQQIPDLRLLLAGYDFIKLSPEKYKFDYRGFLPQKEIPTLINACNVVVIPYLPGKQVQQSNACKISEYIACGVPVVATKVSNHEEIFADAPQSLCDPGIPESMASAIKAQLDSPQLMKNTGTFTWEKLTGKLASALNEILESRTN